VLKLKKNNSGAKRLTTQKNPHTADTAAKQSASPLWTSPIDTRVLKSRH